MNRLRTALGAACAAGGLVLVLAAPALASTTADHHPAGGGHAQAGAPRWGDPCDQVGDRAGGLVCVQGQHDDCPRWHSVSHGAPGSGWVRPSTPACPLCSPSASASTSPAAPVSPTASTPSASTSPSPALTPAVAPSSPAAVTTSAAAMVCTSPADSGDGMLETPAAGCGGPAAEDRLPQTGAPVAGLMLAGLGLLGGGGLLVRSGRRRDAAVA